MIDKYDVKGSAWQANMSGRRRVKGSVLQPGAGQAGMEKILVIDDDEAIRKLIKDFLQKENYIVETAKNGSIALKMLSSDPGSFQLVVLDLMLPDISGTELCRQVRMFSDIPIIMLTAKSEDTDKITGLELGADDYMTKPFNPKELVARIKAIMRRGPISGIMTRKPAAALPILPEETITVSYRIAPLEIKLPEKIFHQEIKLSIPAIIKKRQEDLEIIKKVEINPSSRMVRVDGEEVRLTNKEYNMLLYFIENKNIVLSREKLLEKIWGYDFIGESRTIDVHVKELRKKIGDLRGNLIKTVWSVGYKLNYDEALNHKMESK
ncbi:MAG: Transcriptional regulatory protein SrrA [Actinobacteria bacterium ADurb.Bin346]|nr:MAG: Transcriptional regulatory protein SrrA [Actinobacteria bacterium ADurb.Bin346]